MDDMEFAAELEKLEPVAPRAAVDPSELGHSGWDDLDEGLVSDVVSDDADSAEWTPKRATFADEPVFTDEDASAAGSSVGRTILLAGGFLLLIGVGAGTAAMVFHNRLALILR